ncbi:DUF1993 domain-containing protein [Muricoccus aerilatus]|uniref:DUF1993 domain-containing protein n=1 Tax=Muricoccus aerilatus TaxID=452982 RepID=UPI0005C1CA15|nr:DUF1993 domain-containing protein [Roseomonas aerilata]
MSLSLYGISVPVFRYHLDVLSALLAKGEAHARSTGEDPSLLVAARLAPDMLTLAGQVQRASDTSKLTAARLTGISPPAFPDEETTFDELQLRIRKTTDFLDSVTATQFEGAEGREIVLGSGSNARRFASGTDYVLGFALPNFFFHVTTAYDILRHKGVGIGKGDFLGAAGR